MSEFINNREYRQNVLKSILEKLHDGKTVDEVKAEFEEAFGNVSAEEISMAEQALIQGGLPVAEIQRLCDVHAEVFKGSIEEIHAPSDVSGIPGHPANVMKMENRAIERLLAQLRDDFSSEETAAQKEALQAGLASLYEGIDIHYKKKENLFFPFMEKHGITAPPKVMWGVDDEIREMLKGLVASLKENSAESLQADLGATFTKITEMIFKEENILLAILIENLTQEEWQHADDGSSEFGYCLLTNVPKWKRAVQQEEATEASVVQSIEGSINLPSGHFTVQELTAMLNTLPFDVTFVGKDDAVRYFTEGSERVFPRTRSIIGRQVSNCHPPASVHIVEKIVSDFKEGVKDSEDFWIQMRGKFILIRYFAVRDEAGEYLGVLEVTQDIAPIQEITGEKRLVSE